MTLAGLELLDRGIDPELLFAGGFGACGLEGWQRNVGRLMLDSFENCLALVVAGSVCQPGDQVRNLLLRLEVYGDGC